MDEIEDLEQFFVKIGIPSEVSAKYAVSCEKEAITLKMLMQLGERDLKELSIVMGHRKMILNYVREEIGPDDTSISAQLLNLNTKFDMLNKKFAKIFIGEAANRVKKFILKISGDERLLEAFRDHCKLTPDAFERLKIELQRHIETRDAICQVDYEDICSFDTKELQDYFCLLNLPPSDFPIVLTK